MMTPKEQFNHMKHDSNPSQTMTLTACLVGRVPGPNITEPNDTPHVMTPSEQFNRVDHDSNPNQSMTLTACPVVMSAS